MRITVEVTISDLIRREFIFWPVIEHDGCSLYLDEYTLQVRKSKKHKYKPEHWYRRLESRHSIPLTDVPIGESIFAEAENVFRQMVKAKLWIRK
jgi:hypothetical protein